MKHLTYFVLAILIISGCQKNRPFDFRNKYKGTWEFTSSTSFFNMADTSANYNITETYIGLVSYDEKNKIIIQYKSDGGEIEPEISKSGVFEDLTGTSSGGFEGKNKVSWYIRNGGQGGAHIVSIVPVAQLC